jgi:hypothetical protein
MSNWLRYLCVLALVLGSSPLASAERILVDGAEVAAISNESDESRVLVAVTLPENVDNQFVTTARLLLPGPRQQLPRELELIVSPVSRSWAPEGVTWTSPWNTAGGDISTEYSQVTRIPAGTSLSEVSLDVSQAVRAMAFGEIENHGFLVTVAHHQGEGFNAEEFALLDTWTEAQVRVHCREQHIIQHDVIQGQ